MNKRSKWFTKIPKGALFLVISILLMGYLGGQLTNGLVPTQIPDNTNRIVVTPVFTTQGSQKDNLQLNTFGFISPTPTQPVASSGAIAQ